MLFSEEKRFVFVAVPKTGTTAIQTRLREIDPDIRRNEVLDAAGNWRPMPSHATASEIRAVMGSRAADYVFVAFFRDPMEAIRSKYYFYRNGRPARQVRTGPITLRKKPNDGKISVPLALRVLFSRMTTFRIWALLYPFKPGAHFLMDAEGTILVDRIGDFDRLQEDVTGIFGALGYDPASLALGVVNRSDYDRRRGFGPVFSALMRLKVGRDLDLYCRIRQRATDAARSDR